MSTGKSALLPASALFHRKTVSSALKAQVDRLRDEVTLSKMGSSKTINEVQERLKVNVEEGGEREQEEDRGVAKVKKTLSWIPSPCFTEDTGDAEVSDEENSSAAPDAPKSKSKKKVVRLGDILFQIFFSLNLDFIDFCRLLCCSASGIMNIGIWYTLPV
ncbi:hypothetical protein BDP27DRAFT_1368529 [Rhodocollybia butyracea]|uniref:Uncharacterized protein n=1 Tax=Rhodocollybia butyracea TaxID=206335 RepID=A0A9P5PC17_9AGAR|nr:hypothetical protein BDP27DRAFT_1374412 [Rhodocollybia butyracea]KAF9062094.1 hypothetical protein BDP27DRAFT_1369134 [Rhodocollybia butyracea]KAF9062819.1 hypothetical protein BDP27DRAFT_1368529 [Rhodocollybia butyracea]